MKVDEQWEILPKVDFANSANWKKVAADRFAATRLVLFVNRSTGSQSRYGPIVSGHNVSPGDTITVKRRKERIISHTDTVTEAIQHTASVRLLDSLTAKLSSQLTASVPGYSGTVGTEVLASTEKEFTEILEDSLAHTLSFEVTDVDETEHQIVLQGGTAAREAHLRRRFWPRYWDVYLHSLEYVELSYRRKWWWWQVRETIKRASVTDLRLPLCRVTFYEPQLDLDVCYSPVTEELNDADRIEVDSLSTEMPNGNPPTLENLERLARVAFPTNPEERKEAQRRAKTRRIKKKGVTRMAAKRKAVRPTRMAAKRKAARPTRMPAKRKAARKR